MKKGRMRIMIAPIQGANDKDGQLQERIVECCQKAILKKADFICFPEFILNGADTQVLGLQIYDRAQPLLGSAHKWLAKISKDTGLYIAAGMIQKSQIPGRLYSSYLICCPDGKTKNVFQKRYFDDMDQLYMTGSTNKQALKDTYTFGTIAYALGADMETKEYVDEITAVQPDLIIAASYGRKRDAGKLAKKCGCHVAYTGNGYGAVYDPKGEILNPKENEDILLYEITI